MNNSLPRLIDGMIASLRREVIPNTEGEYARGQAFGVIYMLESIKRRADWSNVFLSEQLGALDELGRELDPLRPSLGDAPMPERRVLPALPAASDLQALRDDGDAQVCRIVDWLDANRSGLPAETARAADDAIGRYLTRQLRWEIRTSARPMFEEISRGVESEP